MSPVFDFLRIVAETAGRKNDGFCADGVGIAFLICSFRTDDCALISSVAGVPSLVSTPALSAASLSPLIKPAP